MREAQKVFCIGFNKTGTTTLETVLKYYGLRVPEQHVQEIRTTESAFEGDYGPLLRLISQYDAFQDMPFSQGEIYRVVDTLVPGSKFILTVRDANAWFESLCNYHKKVFGFNDIKNVREQDIEKVYYLYKGYVYSNISRFLTINGDVHWELLYDKSYYIERYTSRNDSIIEYFRNRRNDLLVLDVAAEQDTHKIGEFLGETAPSVAMPHENPSRVPERKAARFSRFLNRTLGRTPRRPRSSATGGTRI